MLGLIETLIEVTIPIFTVLGLLGMLIILAGM